MPSTVELKEQRGQLIKQMQDMVTAANKLDRDLTPEEEQKWDEMDRAQEALKPQINKQHRAETCLSFAAEQEAALKPLDPNRSNVYQGELLTGDELVHAPRSLGKSDMNLCIRDWLMAPRVGYELDARSQHNMQALGVSPHQRELNISLMAKAHRTYQAIDAYEFRDQGVGTPTSGGNLVPDELMREIEIALLEFGGVRRVSTVMRTRTGASLPLPQTNDTTNKGAIIAEHAADEKQAVTFAQLVFGAYMYTSKMVHVSWELMQDSATNMNQLLGRLLGERLGRISNEHQTTGTGTGQPQGVVTGAASSGVTTADNATITIANMIDLKHSVDPAYRRSRSFAWMFNDGVLATLKKIQDTQQRPLWGPLVAAGEPDQFDGTPYVINQDMPGLGTNANKAVLAGDFSKYMIREVMDLTLTRLDERYAELRQVAFVANLRMDAKVNDAGTGPIKHLTLGGTPTFAAGASKGK